MGAWLLRWCYVFASLSMARSGVLVNSASKFKSCCHGKHDLDLAEFVKATNDFLKFLRLLGPWTAASISETRACLTKVEEACTLLEAQRLAASSNSIKKRRAHRLKTVMDLLDAEVASGVHGKGGAIADPSAAMGLLWVRRGLEHWAALFGLEAQRLKASGTVEGGRGAFAKQGQSAYDATVGPFHGWVARNAFKLTLQAAPEWEVVRKRSGLPAASYKDLRRELREWEKAVTALTKRLRLLHDRYDCEDCRKTY